MLPSARACSGSDPAVPNVWAAGVGLEGNFPHRQNQVGFLLHLTPSPSPPALLCLFWHSFHLLSFLLQRTQDDLQRLKSDLRCVSERCCSFLSKAPSGPSTPRLRAELDLLVTKMEQTYGLSSVYLDK